MRELGGFIREPFGTRTRAEFRKQQRNRRQIALQMPGAQEMQRERRVAAPLEGYPSLIQLLCGLRPGEISQLRCADIAALYGQWHFRFAKRSRLKATMTKIMKARRITARTSSSAVVAAWICAGSPATSHPVSI